MGRRTFDIYTSCRIGELSHRELSKLFGITPNKVAKEIMKASAIMEKIISDYLKIIILFAAAAGTFLAR